MEALATIETLYPSKVYQYFVSCVLMRLIFRRPNTNVAGSSFFTKLVSLLTDTNMSIIEGCFGTKNNSLIHYALSSEDVAILVRNLRLDSRWNQSHWKYRIPEDCIQLLRSGSCNKCNKWALAGQFSVAMQRTLSLRVR